VPKQLRNGIGTLNWNLDFYRFCREILACPRRRQAGGRAPLSGCVAKRNVGCVAVADESDRLPVRSLRRQGRFDDDKLQRILDLAMKRSES
jgi:hypothetical protein